MENMIKDFKLIKHDPLLIPREKGLVYEVVRIIDGTPLFLKGHYLRLINSLSKTNSTFKINYEDYRRAFDDLINSCSYKNFNLKTIINGNTNEFYLFESPSKYPESKLYLKGIDTSILHYQRNNPNLKLVNTDLTKMANDLMVKNNAYEVLLVDGDGNITEGSRSNMFFLDNDTIITPPLKSILPGITREKIIETIRENNFKFIEREVKVDELDKLTGAFMSGTSPKILPIRKIENIKYDVQSNTLIKELIRAFDIKIQDDLDSYNRNKSY